MRISILLVMVTISCSALAQNFRLAVFENPPGSMHSNNKASGIAIEIMRELMKRNSLNFNEALLTRDQINSVQNDENTFLMAVSRSPEREEKFQLLGLAFKDQYCFATLKSKPVLKDLDAGKSAKIIGVVKGGSSESFLRKNGFKNLDASPTALGNVRKLFAGRIDAFFFGEKAVIYTANLEKLDSKKIECHGDYNQTEFWIMATKKVPAEIMKKLKESYLALEQEGFIKKVADKYLSAN